MSGLRDHGKRSNLFAFDPEDPSAESEDATAASEDVLGSSQPVAAPSQPIAALSQHVTAPSDRALTLSEVLTRRVSLQWYEGIAIVRGVAERLLERRGVEPRVPDLHQIELVAVGSVVLTGGASVPEPVRRLTQVLQALLNDAEVPVQLRLAIAQGAAPVPTYGSIAAFDQALAYFERPDRAGILKNLYIRAAAAEPATAAAGSLTLDRVAPLPEVTQGLLLAPSGPKRVRRLIAAGLGIAAISALATAGTLYVRSAGMPVNIREVSHATVAAADAVGTAVMTGVSTVSETAGLGRLVSADDQSATLAKPIAPPSPVRSSTKPARRASSAQLHTAGAAGNGTLFGTVVAYEVPASAAPFTDTQPEETPTSEVGVHPNQALDIYTADSDGVTPPVDVRQQLRQAPPLTVDVSELSRIQIVIAADGSVETARLLDSRSDVMGAMLLSAIKTWVFHPATKDNVPVRYKKLLLVSFE